jgi:hypothetical protein
MVVDKQGGSVIESGGKEGKTIDVQVEEGLGGEQPMEEQQGEKMKDTDKEEGEVVPGEGGEGGQSSSSSSNMNLGISSESGVTEIEERSMSPEQQRGGQPSPSSIAKGEEVGERTVGEKSRFMEGEVGGEGGDGGSGKKGTKKSKTSAGGEKQQQQEEVTGSDVGGKRSTRSGKPVTA